MPNETPQALASARSIILPSINKLKGSEDYNTWKFAMKMTLMREKVWGYVTGEAYRAGATPDPEKDAEALTTICLSVETNLYPFVMNASKAKDAWDELAKVFEDKGVNRRISLIDYLLDQKLEKHSSMQSYITAIMSTAQKLTDINKGLDDDLIAVVMLRGLPAEYKPMKMALENSGTEITTEMVRRKLLQEDLRNSLQEVSPGESVLYTKGKKATKKNPKERFKCYGCGGKGHFKNECPELKKQQDKSKEKPSAKESDEKKNKEWTLLTALGSSSDFNPNVWYIDSGASSHMTLRKDWLHDMKEVGSKDLEVTCANDKKLSSAGKGNAVINVNARDLRVISDVTYVPKLAANLLSVSKAVNNGLCVLFSSAGCQFFVEAECSVKGEAVLTGSEEGGIYKLDHAQPVPKNAALMSSAGENLRELWHRRLGHLSQKGMDLLKNGMVEGIFFGNESYEPCVSCIQGKQHRFPFISAGEERTSQKLELIHTDVCGPMSEVSAGGAKYMLIFVDDYTRKIFAYFLESKEQVFEKFKLFKAKVENETDLKIKAICSDNGTEYTNKKFQSFLQKNGIAHQLTVPYTPEQNGVAERTNRSICEMARSMLMDSGLGKKMWAEACETAVYLKNRAPHRAVTQMVPEEKWSGKKINLGHLKVFGCPAYIHVPDQLRTKWDSKSKKAIFVGYCEEGYRFIDPEKPRRIIRARDVIFLENYKKNERDPDTSIKEESDMEDMKEPAVRKVIDSNSVGVEMNDDEEEHLQLIEQLEDVQAPDNIQIETNNTSEEETYSTGEEEIIPEPESERRYPKRNRTAKQYPDYVMYAAISNVDDPCSVEEAMQRTDKEQWKMAMKEELSSMQDNGVWELVKPPVNVKVIGCKWIFKVKRACDGSVRYKARLVAKGYNQCYGIDYFETFSPVVRRSTIRILFTLAVQFDLEINHLDVTTAFLHGELEEVVYMSLPEGIENVEFLNRVCLLKKSIYGLKQASRSWNKKVNKALIELDFKRLEIELCVYFKKIGNLILIICLYVDDFYILYNDKKGMKDLVAQLSTKFKIKDLGEARQCLGMKISRNKVAGTLHLDQEQYIVFVLKKFGMLECNPVRSPTETTFLEIISEAKEKTEDIPYKNLIGCLMYLAINTRPDISYVVSALSRFNDCPTEQLWNCAKRVLRYLKGTVHYSLEFKKCKDKDFNLVGWVDADWAGDRIDRKSYTGYVFKLGECLISWESKKQNLVAQSSTEAEYVGLTEASKEALYLGNLISDLLEKEKGKRIIIFNDNQSAIKLSGNPVHHSRTKHIDVKYHFIRECIENGRIEVRYVPSERMPADVLTKGLSNVKHLNCVRALGLNVDKGQLS